MSGKLFNWKAVARVANATYRDVPKHRVEAFHLLEAILLYNQTLREVVAHSVFNDTELQDAMLDVMAEMAETNAKILVQRPNLSVFWPAQKFEALARSTERVLQNLEELQKKIY